MKIDCGYKADRGTARRVGSWMFQAVSLEGDVEGAKVGLFGSAASRRCDASGEREARTDGVIGGHCELFRIWRMRRGAVSVWGGGYGASGDSGDCVERFGANGGDSSGGAWCRGWEAGDREWPMGCAFFLCTTDGKRVRHGSSGSSRVYGSGWWGLGVVAAEGASGERKTAMLPSILSPYQVGRTGQNALPKPTPANLRKFAETPVVRRAINVVKDKITSMDWQVRVRRGFDAATVVDAEARMKALRRSYGGAECFGQLSSALGAGAGGSARGRVGAVEDGSYGRSNAAVSSVAGGWGDDQIDSRWDGDPAKPRYAQATGQLGKAGTGAAA